MRRFPSLLLLAALLVTPVLGGCSWFSFPPSTRGNVVTEDELKNLVPGTSTKQDVSSLLGSPTARGSFDDNTWIYISEVTQARIGRVPGVNSQKVVELSFDDRGVLKDLKTLDKANAEDVTMVSRTTPSPGSSATFMQMLLGNVGRFSAGPAATPGSGGP